MEDIIDLHVKLVEGNSKKPLTGEGYRVRFYDKDFFRDDFLGESDLDHFGHAIISVNKDDFRSGLPFRERFPDIYFTVDKNGKEIYRSPVAKNIHLEEAGDYPASGALHCVLGTFKV